MEIKVKNEEPCPNAGCKHHFTHPCELCGRIGAQGEATVKWGCLRITGETDQSGVLTHRRKQDRL